MRSRLTRTGRANSAVGFLARPQRPTYIVGASPLVLDNYIVLPWRTGRDTMPYVSSGPVG